MSLVLSKYRLCSQTVSICCFSIDICLQKIMLTKNTCENLQPEHDFPYALWCEQK